MIKCSFKKVYMLTAIANNSFVCLCIRTISFIPTTLNTKQDVVNLNIKYQFEDI